MGIEWGGQEPQHTIDQALFEAGDATLMQRAAVHLGDVVFRAQDALGLLEDTPSFDQVASRGEKLMRTLQATTVAGVGSFFLQKLGIGR